MAEGAGGAELARPPSSTTPTKRPEKSAITALERFLEAAPNVTSTLGEFMMSVGRFEKQAGRSMDALAQDFLSQGGVVELVKVAPPEVVAKFLQVMVRAARVGSPDLKSMTADQKIETGEQMKLLADEMRDLFNSMREIPVPKK